MKGIIEWKDNVGRVIDVDFKSRRVTGLLAHFESKDYNNDVTKPGAFVRSINARGPKGDNSIYFLNFHNFDQPHNTFDVLEERKDLGGLYFEAEMPNTSYSNDTLVLYNEGIIKEHSYGHIVQQKSYTQDGSTKIRNIEETYLLEGSNVTLGMNPNTPFLGFKAKNVKEQEDMISRVMSIIRNGNLTDATFKQLEIGLKQLQMQAFHLGKNSLNEEKDPDISTLEAVDPNKIPKSNLYSSLINVLQPIN